MYQLLSAARRLLEKFESRLSGSNTTQDVVAPVESQHQGDVIRTLFKKWIDEDVDQEHKQTFEYLSKVLDEDRLSDRKLFP